MDNIAINAVTGATGFKAWLDPFELDLYNTFVADHEYECFRSKTTTVILVLKSGFEIVGVSSCEDPLKFNESLGHKYALTNALTKLGEFAAFHRAELKRQTPVVKARELSPFEIEELRNLLRRNEGRSPFVVAPHPVINESTQARTLYVSGTIPGDVTVRKGNVVSTTSKAYEAQVKAHEKYNNI